MYALCIHTDIHTYIYILIRTHCHYTILILALTCKFEFKPSSDKTSLPLHHIFSTPAGVFIHLHLPFAQHLRQGGEERFVPLDVAHKLPAGSSGFQEVMKNHQTVQNYTVQPVLPHSSRFSNQTCPNTDRHKRRIGLPYLFVIVINADSVLPCSHTFI